MIKCKLALCADRVIRDADTETISAVAIFEAITIQFPALLGRLSCLFVLARDEPDPETFDGLFRLNLESNQIFASQVHVDFQGKLRNRVTINILGVPLQTPGTLRAELVRDGSVIAAYEFTVAQGSSPPIEVKTA